MIVRRPGRDLKNVGTCVSHPITCPCSSAGEARLLRGLVRGELAAVNVPHCFVSDDGASNHVNGSVGSAVTDFTTLCRRRASSAASSAEMSSDLRLSRIVHPPARGSIVMAPEPRRAALCPGAGRRAVDVPSYSDGLYTPTCQTVVDDPPRAITFRASRDQA